MTNETSAMSGTTGKKAYGAGALVALAVLFLGVIILLTFLLRGARLDLTESKLYSIAPGTQHILETLQEPINLYFFFSQDASRDSPQIRAYAQRVRELLEEMSQRSKGKLRLSVIDPQPFSEDEDRAAEFGLQSVPTGGRGDSLYFGLAGTNSTDGREVIGFFQPEKEEFLEYDVASLIHRLNNTKRAKIGLMSSLPVDASFDPSSGGMRPGWASISQLRELFDVQTVAADVTSIAADIDTLMIVHPRELTPKTQYAIDQFVLRGGKLIAFMDPQSENDPQAAQMAQMGGMMGNRSSTLGPLLDAWGVTFDAGQVLGDRELGLTVSLQQGQPPSQHIAIVGFNRASMNSKDVVTSALDSINVMTAGTLKKKEGATVDFEPMIESSTNAALLPVAKLAFLPDSASLLDGFKATGERYAVAARVHGKVKSAFANGAPEGADAGQGLKESAQDANIILVADTDILADPLWIRSQNLFGQRVAIAWANNGDFLANALDNLAGSSDLISIRGRQSFFRPFTKVEALRRQADDRLRAKEKELDSELRETEQKLSQLQSGRANQNELSLSPEQEAELTRFQQERSRIRKELREVRRSLDVEIESLGTTLKFLNILLVPALIAIGAIVLAVTRRRRLRAGRAAAHTGSSGPDATIRHARDSVMTSRKVLILAVAAVAVLAIALLLSQRHATSEIKEAQALYPDLKKELNAVTAVKIFKAGDTQSVEIARKDNQWVVTERTGFPANTAKVNKLLIALGDAKPVEEKTSNPESYPALGVEDVTAATASGTRIEVQGTQPPVNLIVGKSAGARGAYVRRAGEASSWLIDQNIDVSSTPGEWLRTSIVDVTADRLQSATVTTAGAKPYTVEKATRADEDFKTTAVPKGKEADQYALNGFATALSNLNLSDVRPAKDFESEKPAGHVTVRTFDGLVADLDGWEKDGKHFVAVNTSYDAALAQRFHVETKPAAESKASEKAADEKKSEAAAPAPEKATADNVADTAKKTNDQLKGWVFEIPDYKYEAIFKPATALVKK